MKRNILKSLIVAALLGAAGLASKFNTNASAPGVRVEPAKPRKRAFRTGIKGIANTNNTAYGSGLRHHFEQVRGRGGKVVA